jgi:hypothetical protein
MTKVELGALIESVLELRNVGHPEAAFKVLENTLARIDGKPVQSSGTKKSEPNPAS